MRISALAAVYFYFVFAVVERAEWNAMAVYIRCVLTVGIWDWVFRYSRGQQRALHLCAFGECMAARNSNGSTTIILLWAPTP